MYASPTNVVAEQSAYGTVIISWTAPSYPTPSSYHLIISSTDYGNRIFTDNLSPFYASALQPGLYGVRLVALSQSGMYQIPSLVNFTVRGSARLSYALQ